MSNFNVHERRNAFWRLWNLIEAKDAQSLSEALNKYLTGKKIRTIHSSNAIQKVKELYSSDVIIDLMMRLYD